MSGSGRFAARIARPIAAGAMAIGAVLAMTAPALGQPPSWSVVPSPNGTGSLLNGLEGISCPSVTACTAVGFYQNSRHVLRTLAESWNGTSWSVVPSPNVGSSSENLLEGVSCLSPAACTAVGSHANSSGAAKTLVESWNGTSWSVVPSPSPGPSFGPDVLGGVSCVSATACTAVGSYEASNVQRALAESWNGTSWSVVPAPTPGQGAELNGVSCVSATACTAAGFFFRSGNVVKTLVESWNGTSWSVVPTPNPPPVNGSSFLNGVSCVSVTACTVAGYHVNSSNVQRVLVESWNGTSWSVVPSQNAGRATSSNILGGVSCVSATACTAVGDYENFASGTDKTLVESWNGTSWSVVPSPNAGLSRSLNFLNGVSCVSAVACTAVGAFHSSGSPEMTLIESSG